MATNQSLIEMLELARDGTMLERLEDHFNELNLEVLRLGKQGSLTLKITATPDEGARVDYAIEPTLKLPKRAPTRVTMFVHRKSGKTSATNPEGKQEEIPIDSDPEAKSGRFKVVN